MCEQVVSKHLLERQAPAMVLLAPLPAWCYLDVAGLQMMSDLTPEDTFESKSGTQYCIFHVQKPSKGDGNAFALQWTWT